MDYQDAIKQAVLTVCLMMVAQLFSVTALAQYRPEFSLPLDCSGNSFCLVQNMVDLDVGPGRRDPHCGAATYNGHKGTDIRLRNLGEMRRGVAVLAMADGIVTAVQDGVEDHLVQTDRDRKRVRGRECGNSVIVDHRMSGGAKYTTRYCHMAQNSLTVRKGHGVRRGQEIGQVGLSGATQFPHIHISVRKNGRVVDPITGQRQDQTCVGKSAATSLFSNAAYKLLMKKGFRPLIEDGFASGPVSGKAVLAGTVPAPGRTGLLVYFARFINLEKGDSLRLAMVGPNGVVARSQTRPLSRNKATYTAYVGKKSGLICGTYTGRVALIRQGKAIFSHMSDPFTLNQKGAPAACQHP
jgi:hypothetical protein